MLKACLSASKNWIVTFTVLVLSVLSSIAWAQQASVICDSPVATASASGGTTTITVDCAINAPDSRGSYRITASANNFMAPSAVYLNRGLRFLTATLQPSVTSPDNSVTSISGTSSGFTADLSNSTLPRNLRFQYSVTTNASTPAGTYTSLLSPVYYRYRICNTPSCNNEVSSGNATTFLRVAVAASPTTVSCSSEPATAPPGGGTFSLNVLCMVSGTGPEQLSPSSQNVFSPSTITLTGNNANINATLQPLVTSPDSSVTGISGTAGGGFTGTVSALPAKIQVQYRGTTTETTRAGTYTSSPVVFVWSAI